MNYNDVKLIELVKHCPTVYDSKIAEFKIPHRKEEAWEIISKEMEITGEWMFIQQATNSKSNNNFHFQFSNVETVGEPYVNDMLENCDGMITTHLGLISI